MPKDWKKMLARDIMALGGIPFYAIVIARAAVGRYPLFIYQLLIALFVLFGLTKLIKDSNPYVSRGFILVVFSSIFYKDIIYTVFAALMWVLIIFSLSYLKVKEKQITKGISIGILSTIISAYVSSLI